jgi:ArsR family transcriptional regulator
VLDRHYEGTARFFKALAHPARLQILDTLRKGDVCVCHLEALLGKSQAYISQQLALLREAGLVRDRREGQRVYYAIADQRLLDLLNEFLGPAGPAARLDYCRCPRCQIPITA